MPRPDPLGYWWQILAISTWSSFPWVSQVQQPTLVLAGARDRVVPVNAARLLAREIPNAKLVVVDGEHWFLVREGTEEAAAHITEFLGEAPGVGRRSPPGCAEPGELVCT